MKRTALLFFVCLTPLVSSAQEWKPGYIERPDGERVTGQIADEGWERSPVSVQFRESAQGAAQSFTAETIRGFGIDGGEQYSALTVQYDPEIQSERNSRALPDTREPGRLSSGSFLMSHRVRGRLSLYLWIDPNGRKHYFLQRDRGEAEELMYRRYRSTNEKNEDVVKINVRFRQQIQQAISDCPASSGGVEELDYTDKDLKEVVDLYNQCKGAGSEYLYSAPKSPTYFGLVAESFFYQANLGNPVSPWGPPHFGAGVSYEIVSPKRNGRYSMLFEGKLRWLEQDGEDTYYNQEAIFTVTDIRVVFMPRFNYKLGSSSQWFWNVGVAFSFDINSGITYTNGQEIYANSYEGPDYGFAMGVGACVLNKPKSALTLEFRYEQGYGFQNVFNFGKGIQSLGLTAAYKRKGGR